MLVSGKHHSEYAKFNPTKNFSSKLRIRVSGSTPWQPPLARPPYILFSFPLELRNTINELALIDGTFIHVAVYHGKRWFFGTHRPWREPGLLRLSHAIRAEASAIFYRLNDFPNRSKTRRLRQALRMALRPGSALRHRALSDFVFGRRFHEMATPTLCA